MAAPLVLRGGHRGRSALLPSQAAPQSPDAVRGVADAAIRARQVQPRALRSGGKVKRAGDGNKVEAHVGRRGMAARGRKKPGATHARASARTSHWEQWVVSPPNPPLIKKTHPQPRAPCTVQRAAASHSVLRQGATLGAVCAPGGFQAHARTRSAGKLHGPRARAPRGGHSPPRRRSPWAPPALHTQSLVTREPLAPGMAAPPAPGARLRRAVHA